MPNRALRRAIFCDSHANRCLSKNEGPGTRKRMRDLLRSLKLYTTLPMTLPRVKNTPQTSVAPRVSACRQTIKKTSDKGKPKCYRPRNRCVAIFVAD